MKKNFLSFAIVALAAGMMASCGNKSANTEGEAADSTAVEEEKMAAMGTWEYPEGSAIENAEEISCVL